MTLLGGAGPSAPIVHQPSLAAKPQSGQTATLNSEGFAGAVASGSPVEVETFIRRVAAQLGYQVVDPKGLVSLASECASVAKQKLNCEPAKMGRLLDELTTKLSEISKVPGSWLASSQPNPMLTGDSAPLTAGGFLTVLGRGFADTEVFVKRLLSSFGYRVVEPQGMSQFISQWSESLKLQGNAVLVKAKYDEMLGKIHSDARVPGAWLAPGAQPSSAPTTSGQVAPLTAVGLAGAAATGNPIEVGMLP